jgi:PKD repeat protein
MMQDNSVNFYDVKQEFENYWQDKSIEKGKGWKQYKRWEYFMESRVFPTGDRFPASATYNEYKNYLLANPRHKSLIGQWNYIGNNFVPVGGGAGRVTCLAFEPGNSNVIYAGTPAGGLWKSVDAGSTWITYTDDLASMGISSIAMHPTDPNILFVGTGDGDAGDTYSVGVLKSTDGGTSFQTTGLSFNYNSGITIRKLIINPQNPDVLIAATSSGIYKSADGAVTWTQSATGSYYDLEFKPNDTTKVYAVTNGKFFLSTDAGDNFTQITDGLPTGVNSAGRMAIGVTVANSNYVYLLTGKNSDNGFYALFRSTDGGVTFTERSDSPNILGWEADGSDSGGQAWYDLSIVVSPINANLLWTGGVNLWKSTNGGTNWVLDAHWYGGGGQPYVHADVHAMENIPGNNSSFLVGCDGGIFKTTNLGSSYSDISNNLKISQSYKMSQSVTDPNVILTGWQDNGTNLKTALGFRRVLGGDGMDCIVDHTNDDIMYGEYYYGRIFKSTNNGFNFTTIVSSNDTLVSVNEPGEWVTPYIMHPADQNTLLVGKSQLFRSTDGGTNWAQVDTISGGSGKLIALAYAESDPNYIYIIKRNRFFASSDGNTFTNRTTGLPTSASMTNLVVDPNDPLRVWVTFSGFSAGAKVYYTANGGVNWSNFGTGIPNIPVNCIIYENGSNDGLYIGTDMGVFYRNTSHTSWQYYSNGLPNTIVNDMEIYYATGKLRAATYGRGIWETELFTNVQNDAAVNVVELPSGNVCNTVFSPVISLKNSGDNDLTSVELNYSIDGGGSLNYSWTGMLHPSETVELTLPVLTTSSGAHTFEISTDLPNGTSDGNSANDSLNTNFNVINTGNVVNFILTQDCFGEEISWNIIDGSSQLVYEINAGYYEGNTSDPLLGGLTLNKSVCLDAGCYTFRIDDAGGNGLFGTGTGCDMNGTYLMNDQAGTLLFQNAIVNGNFGTDETHNFCVTNVYAAAFSASPTQICSGAEIQYNDLSPAGTNSWNWTFPGGNPATSVLPNPIITYATAGTYDVILQTGDGTNSNTKTIIDYVTVYDSPIASVIFDSISCFGDCSAMIDLSVAGGTTPLRFDWSSGETVEDLANVCAGNYEVMINDDIGCSDSASISIYSPAEIDLGLIATQATCGISDGSVSSNVTGGLSPYDLLWSTSDVSTSISGLGIGGYTLSVTNVNAPTVDATSINETCGGECDGAIQSLATGGTGTLNYTWSNGAGTTDTISPICPGTYIISVLDSNGCEDRDTVIVVAGTAYPVAGFTTADTVVSMGATVNFVNLSSGANQHAWDFGDGGTSTFSSTSHIFTTEGTFMVVLVSCKNGCCDSDTMTINVIDFTSVNEMNENEFVKIYPNPADEILYIDFKQAFTESTIRIYDGNGKLVLNKKENNSAAAIDISSFSKGIYLVEISCYDTVLKYKVVKR